MAADIIDILGFVLTIISLLMALKIWQLIRKRLPPGRLQGVDKAITETRTHIRRLERSGHITAQHAAEMYLRCDVLTQQHDQLWVEVEEWKARGHFAKLIHPTRTQLSRNCSGLLNSVSALRRELRPQSSTPEFASSSAYMSHTSFSATGTNATTSTIAGSTSRLPAAAPSLNSQDIPTSESPKSLSSSNDMSPSLATLASKAGTLPTSSPPSLLSQEPSSEVDIYLPTPATGGKLSAASSHIPPPSPTTPDVPVSKSSFNGQTPASRHTTSTLRLRQRSPDIGYIWCIELDNCCRKQRLTVQWNEARSGPSDTPVWTASAWINGIEFGSGSAHRVAAARDLAAQQAVRTLWCLRSDIGGRK